MACSLVVLLVVIADQAVKFYVKTHFYLGEDLPFLSWWHIKFIENNGMAFGLELTSKIFLTFARIVAVGLLVWALTSVRKIPGLSKGFVIAVALITAGAAGNIFRLCVLRSDLRQSHAAGYSSAFPLLTAVIPHGSKGEWSTCCIFLSSHSTGLNGIPGVGGTFYEFFAYIFNIADASICIGGGVADILYSSDLNQALGHVAGKYRVRNGGAAAKGEKGQVEMKNIHAPLVIAATAFLFASGCVKRPSKVLSDDEICRLWPISRLPRDMRVRRRRLGDRDRDRLVEYVIEKHGVSRRNLIRPWLGTVGM